MKERRPPINKKRKGIILAGGSSTRLQPTTHVISKQLLPIYDKPVIYYPLAVLMMAGIREVIIISTSRDLSRLKALFKDGSHLGISISYGVQDKPRGIADALLVAKEFIGDDHVGLILGDNLFCGDSLEHHLEKATDLEKGGMIFGYEVNRPERYGVIKFDNKGTPIEIIEKPEKPPSNYAVTGIYFYDNQVMDIASNLTPSARGELEITDVNNAYLKKGELSVQKLGRGCAWFDVGNPDDLLTAANYVQIIQKKQNLLIGCIEEVAHKKGYISDQELEKLADLHSKSIYGSYLRQLLP